MTLKYFQCHVLVLLKLYCLTAIFLCSPAQSKDTIDSEVTAVCVNAVRTENFKLAEELCQQQLKIALKNNHPSDELTLLIALMDVYKHTENDLAFFAHADQAENHPLFGSSPHNQYKWYRLQAIKLHHRGKHEQSNQLFLKALKIAINLKDPTKISHSNIDLGISSSALGDFKTSLQHYRNSLELTRGLNNSYDIGLSLKSVANVYLKLEEYQPAADYYEEALKAYLSYSEQEVYDPRVHHRINTVYSQLVDVYQQLNQPDAARHYQNKLSQSQTKAVGNHDLANRYVKQAKQNMATENFNQAVTQLNQALQLYLSQGIKNPVQVYHLLAQIHQRLNQPEIAIYYANEGLKNFKKGQPNHSSTSEIFNLLSQLHADSDPQLALQYAQKFTQQREAFLAHKYDTDLKTIQHQIELEKNQNKLITSQLNNIKQKVKIQTLNNKYLISLLLLLCLLALVIHLNIKKKRQKTELKAVINFHKNQLAILSLSTQPQHPSHHNTSEPEIKQSDVKEQLVAMMHDAVNLWVELTGENLIELAHRSKIWTITNDNGTLRARSMEKYLAVKKIPNNPRWRNVVRTCHFVLTETGLSQNQRACLNQKLATLMQLIKNYYGTDKKSYQ